MPDELGHFQVGRKFKPSARLLNRLVDAAQAIERQRHNRDFGFPPVLPQGSVIRVKNQTGQDLPANSIMALDQPIFLPEKSLGAFRREVTFRGTIPRVPTHLGKFCVLRQPLAIGQIGEAYVDGVCIAKVEIHDPRHTCCDVSEGDTDDLSSMANGGSAEILWQDGSLDADTEKDEGGTKVRWCIIRLGTNCRICCGSSSSSSSTTHSCPTNECPQCKNPAPCDVTIQISDGVSTTDFSHPDCAGACNNIRGPFVVSHTSGCSWTFSGLQVGVLLTVNLFNDGTQWTVEGICTDGSCTMTAYWHSSDYNCTDPLSVWTFDNVLSTCVCADCGIAVTP